MEECKDAFTSFAHEHVITSDLAMYFMLIGVFVLAQIIDSQVTEPPPLLVPVPAEHASRVRFDPSAPSLVTAVSGRTTFLLCRVSSDANETVSWIRYKDLAILSAGDRTFSHDGRIHLYHQPNSRDWVLKIKFVRPSDSGWYGCQVPTSPSSWDVQLRVIVPTTQLQGEEGVYVDVGSTLTLTCTVTAPAPQRTEFIFWYHNTTLINYAETASRVSIATEGTSSSTTSFLRIEAARPSDTGAYTCSPSNSAAAAVNVHVLTVETPAAMQTNESAMTLPSMASSFLAMIVLMAVGRVLL